MRAFGLNLNPAYCEIAYIARRGFLEAGLVLGFTIKLESFRIHIRPMQSRLHIEPVRRRLYITHMFHTLLNVQRGEAIPLQRCIDNRDGRLSIGLRSITFAAGWYNIEKGEKFFWKNTGRGNSGAVEESLTIPPGLYGFDRLKEVLKGASSSPTHTLTACGENGLITLTVAPGWAILLSDGLLALLGLDDGLGGVWLDDGVYTGDRPVNFATRQMLWVHLVELNTSENIVNGAPSTLLACIGLGQHGPNGVPRI